MKNKTNEIVKYEDHAEVILYDKYGNEKARALIDLEDIDRIKQHRWYFDGRYVRGHVSKSNRQKLHRFIMNISSEMVIDHINHNPLDNRKCNLRVCTQQQNCINKVKQSNNTSGHSGVGWYKKYNKWRARIQVNGKQILLGYFEDKNEAIAARKQAEIDYFGEYRNKEDEED